MPSQTNTVITPPPPRQCSLLAGLLSYLIPGLGQIYQGRVAKGVLFMICLLGMFFAGQYLGDWQNVYLPDRARGEHDVVPWDDNPFHLPPILHPLANVYHRWHFAGQFWIGIAAWPALWQYNKMPVPDKDTSPFWHNFQRTPEESQLNQYLTNSDKTPDVAWVYTVIAGVLNILVIYDAFAGPAYILANPNRDNEPKEAETKPQEKAAVA
jgi:uncharacterized protein DUF6677